MSERRFPASRRAREVLGSVRRFFDTGNLLRFLLSLVLAFGLWAWVTYQNDPETTRVLGGLSVSVENLEGDLQIVGEAPTVDVTIQGPQSIITPLERESVIAYVDLEEVDGVGEHEVDVRIQTPNDVRVRDVVPESVTIELDQLAKRDNIAVEFSEPEDVPPDYQIHSINVDPDVINVVGPGGTLQQISRAEVQVQVFGRTRSFTEPVAPVLLDASGDELSGLTTDPEEVIVTVLIEETGFRFGTNAV